MPGSFMEMYYRLYCTFGHIQVISTKLKNTVDDYCEILVDSFGNCSDFRYESNGIFVLGVGFFFFRQISTF